MVEKSMLSLQSVHHIAIICSNYQVSRKFYTEILGLAIVAEHYREERDSWKLDLSVNGQYAIELFSFPDPPKRVSRPEACGLRHLAFRVEDIEAAANWLRLNGVTTESVRIDEFSGKRFTFFADPDDLPIEIYEA